MTNFDAVNRLVEEAVLAQPYFCFLLGKPSDVNFQFNERTCFPLGFLYYPSANIELIDYGQYEVFNIALELIDLNEIQDKGEASTEAVISRMYLAARNVIAYLNQYDEGFAKFQLSGISITPLADVTTNAKVTSGVRLDFQFRPEPDFSDCFI